MDMKVEASLKMLDKDLKTLENPQTRMNFNNNQSQTWILTS
jgi:hypothetical protein